MAASVESSSSSLFQFVALRDPQKYPSVALERRFIKFDWTLLARKLPAGLNIAAQPPGNLFASLAFYRTDPINGLSKMLEEVIRYETTKGSNFIGSVAQLRSAYPEFTKVYEWISPKRRTDTTITSATLQAQMEASTVLNQTIAAYLGTANFQQQYVILWENLVAQILMPTNNSLPQELTNTIRMIWLAQRLNNGDPQLKNMQDIYEGVRATIVLQSEIFPLPQPGIPVPLYRLYHPASNDHFYTISADERDSSVALSGYNYEGVACHVFSGKTPGSTDLFRLYNPGNGDHFYTTDPNEQANAVNNAGYTAEKTECYVFTSKVPGSRALYRLYHPNAQKHFYTTSPEESHSAASVSGYNAEFVACYVPDDYAAWPGTKGKISPCFIADFKSVQTQLLLYAKGEIAQISNLMGGEKNTRVVREFDRNEESILRDTETTTETERETQETDKNELSQEASQLLKEDIKLDVGVNLSANFGSVSIQTKTGFNYQNSKETTNKVATKLSKDVMNRALTRITERVRQQTTTTTIHESEDTTTHSLKNPGANSLSAIYRWVDKYYLAKLISYGSRTIIDLIIPEPAAFYIYTQKNKPKKDLGIDPPPPFTKNGTAISLGDTPLTPRDINTTNYLQFAARYRATGITAPPPDTAFVGYTYNRPFDSQDQKTIVTNADADKLLIEPGYYAQTMSLNLLADDENIKPCPYFEIYVGKFAFGFPAPAQGFDHTAALHIPTFDMTEGGNTKITGKVPVGFLIAPASSLIFDVVIQCKVTDERLNDWKSKTFDALFVAYTSWSGKYNDKLASATADDGTTAIQGKNTTEKREIEKEELKKACLELLTAQRFESFDSVTSDPLGIVAPEFDFSEATDEGRYSRFFEDSFEWPLISYIFYPYFWGRKKNWVETKRNEDTDALFTKFLQAGAARVIVPIRQGFEAAIQHYLCTGQIWNGGDVPTVDDDLYVSIADEMKEAAGHFDGEKVVDQWTVKVPTNFVIIDDAANPAVLPDYSFDLLGHKATLADLTT